MSRNYLDCISDYWSVCHLFDLIDPVQCIEWKEEGKLYSQAPLRNGLSRVTKETICHLTQGFVKCIGQFVLSR